MGLLPDTATPSLWNFPLSASETARIDGTRAATAADLSLLLALAFAIRLAAYRLLPNIYFPDEVFQITEPAHRLVFGTGIVTWEWVAHIRSWLFPGILAALMAAGGAIGTDPATIMLPVACFMGAASLAPVVCGYLWGRRFGGRSGGIVAGAINATSVDLVYIATHTLSGVIAGDFLIAALYLGDSGSPLSRRRLFWCGIMLGLTFAFRFHLGPALGVAALWICRARPDHWRHVLAGAAIPVAALGLLDWMTLDYPFQSILANVWMNLFRHVEEGFGATPPSTLWLYLLFHWWLAAPLILAGVALGARKVPLLLVVAASIVLTFSIPAHKEIRFVYPALPLLVTLVALAAAEFAGAVQRKRGAGGAAAALVILVWTAISIGLSFSPEYCAMWTTRRGYLRAFEMMSSMPDLCGVAVYGGISPLAPPGNTWLPPRVPLYQTNAERLAREIDGFNVVLADEKAPIRDARFERMACLPSGLDSPNGSPASICIWHRAGGCTPGKASFPAVDWPAAIDPDRPDTR